MSGCGSCGHVLGAHVALRRVRRSDGTWVEIPGPCYAATCIACWSTCSCPAWQEPAL